MYKIINKKVFTALFLLFCWIGFSAQKAEASHLRGVTMSWAPTSTLGEVEFRFLYSQAGTPAVGTNITAAINFGDGTSGSASGPVTSVNFNDNYFVADLKVRKFYSGNGPYTAFWSNCCRISNLRNGADGNIRLETIVRPRSGNSAPVVSLPTVVTVPISSQVQFTIPASDADGNRLRYRMAGTGEMGVVQPSGFSVNSDSGLVTWNTAGLNPQNNNLFVAQVIVEDLDANGNVISKVPVDFILKFVANVGTPPSISINPAGPITVSANTPVSFSVTGTDPDPNARVTLNGAGLPAGATMTPAIGAQLSPPVTSTFNWTPTTAQAGPTGSTYILNFTATDDTNQQALRSITINVLAVGAPTAQSQSITAAAGVPQNVTLSATDPNGLNLTFSLTGSPAKGTAVLTGSPSCSVSGGVSTCTQNAVYTPGSSATGTDSFTFRANNGVQNSNAANVGITIASNLAPTVNCPANPAPVPFVAPGGASVPVSFVVGDPNGDALSVQWRVNGNLVQTDSVAASASSNPVTLSRNYAVGTHYVQVTVIDSSNAQVTSCTVQVVVNKAGQSIIFGPLADKTYGDGDFAVSASSDSNLPVSFAASGDCTISGSNVSITGAGTCQITASQSGDGNFDPAVDVVRSFTIHKAEPAIAVNGYNGVFDGAPHGANGSATGVFGEALTGLDLGSSFTNAPGGTANWTFTDTTGNYNDKSGSVAIDISKAPTSTILNFESGPYVYRGSAFTATASVSAATGFGDSLNVVYSGDCTNVSANDGCVATATYPESENYLGSSDSKSITITKASSSTVVTCDPASLVFTGSALTPCTVAVSGVNLSLTPDAVYQSNVNVGTASASYTFAGDDNHTGSDGSATFEITKASSSTVITCNPSTVTYNGAAQTPCSVSVTGAGGLNLSPAANYSNNTNAGTAGASYSFNGDSNHDSSSDSVNFTIAKADPSVIVNGYTGTFDGAAHGATGTATGVLGESLSGLDLGASFTNVPGGTANWTYTDATGNYNNKSGSAAIVITKANPVCTVNGYTGSYNGSAQGASGSCLGVSGETLAGLDLGATFTLVPGGTANWTFTDVTGNYNNTSGTAAITITTAYCFDGFHSPIGGAVENGNGGSYANPVRSFKLGSTIPVKFTLRAANNCSGTPILTGIHTLQAIRYSSSTASDAPIDATPTDSATTGNQFRLTGDQWHFNMSTKGWSTNLAGTWLIVATLQDGSVRTVWVSLKK